MHASRAGRSAVACTTNCVCVSARLSCINPPNKLAPRSIRAQPRAPFLRAVRRGSGLALARSPAI